ncbi:MAG TPA: YncE family protein [Stellaceae bacterium]|jgi:DNA-binding beta-propeller fold protein YncE|nr:YncE family protein [Stellaceae bacterium]
MKKHRVAAIAIALACSAPAAHAQYLVSGNDEKRSWDVAGKLIDLPPGKDSVSIIDIRNRVEPKIVATLPLKNTIHGPPTNLAITPDNRMALVANSLDAVADGAGWKDVPDNEIFVIDLTANPPKLVSTVTAGKQPSGMAIDRGGNFALVADRADNAVSLLNVNGKTKTASLVATVPMSIPDADPTAVAITPDSKRALVTLTRVNKVALLTIDNGKVTDTGYAMTTGIDPYNVQITPDGKLGLVNNQGSGASDGQADTLSVIDLEQNPPRVVDQVMVGDGPEGLAVSPAGSYAAALLLNGTGSPKAAFYHHEHSLVALLKIEGKKVHKVAEEPVEGSSEGIAFSPDGRFLYVGSFSEGEIAILRLQGEKLVPVGTLKLPGHPASLRGNTP